MQWRESENEKFLSALYKLKIDSAENKRKRNRKHDNAEKSKKRKEETASNRTWDIVATVMNEKANLEEVVELWPLLLTEIDTEFLQNATPKGNFNGLLKLKKASLFSSSVEKLVDKALDRMREKIKSVKSRTEY